MDSRQWRGRLPRASVHRLPKSMGRQRCTTVPCGSDALVPSCSPFLPTSLHCQSRACQDPNDPKDASLDVRLKVRLYWRRQYCALTFQCPGPFHGASSSCLSAQYRAISEKPIGLPTPDEYTSVMSLYRRHMLQIFARYPYPPGTLAKSQSSGWPQQVPARTAKGMRQDTARAPTQQTTMRQDLVTTGTWDVDVRRPTAGVHHRPDVWPRQCFVHRCVRFVVVPSSTRTTSIPFQHVDIPRIELINVSDSVRRPVRAWESTASATTRRFVYA